MRHFTFLPAIAALVLSIPVHAGIATDGAARVIAAPATNTLLNVPTSTITGTVNAPVVNSGSGGVISLRMTNDFPEAQKKACEKLQQEIKDQRQLVITQKGTNTALYNKWQNHKNGKIAGAKAVYDKQIADARAEIAKLTALGKSPTTPVAERQGYLDQAKLAQSVLNTTLNNPAAQAAARAEATKTYNATTDSLEKQYNDGLALLPGQNANLKLLEDDYKLKNCDMVLKAK